MNTPLYEHRKGCAIEVYYGDIDRALKRLRQTSLTHMHEVQRRIEGFKTKRERRSIKRSRNQRRLKKLMGCETPELNRFGGSL